MSDAISKITSALMKLQGPGGNVDLAHRPVVNNADGSYSTVLSKSFNIDGKEVLLPTISPSGVKWTDQGAIAHYLATGQNLGIFNSVEEANRAAQQIHEEQALQYGRR